jgi:RNA polymerase sigma-70 factor (ECF subfamily)
VFPTWERASLSYAEAAERLGVTEPGVKTLIHRLRERHRQLVREEVAHTVTTAGEVDEELRHLIAVISD